MDWQTELEKTLARSARLSDFDAGITAKLKNTLGSRWHSATDDERDRLLTQRQRDWGVLRYFGSAWSNGGDLFSHLCIIYAHRSAFEMMGAARMLAAADTLRELHEQEQSLVSQDEKDAFWHQTLNDRLPIEKSSESFEEYENLLIRFAELHPDEFHAVPAGDPSDRLFEYLDALTSENKKAPN